MHLLTGEPHVDLWHTYWPVNFLLTYELPFSMWTNCSHMNYLFTCETFVDLWPSCRPDGLLCVNRDEARRKGNYIREQTSVQDLYGWRSADTLPSVWTSLQLCKVRPSHAQLPHLSGTHPGHCEGLFAINRLDTWEFVFIPLNRTCELLQWIHLSSQLQLKKS